MFAFVTALVLLFALSSAAPFFGHPGAYPYGHYGLGYHHYPYYYTGYNNYYPHGTYDRWIFYGVYPGSCEGHSDGLYYVDEYSFAYCSHGKKTIQPCAEGAANPPMTHYTSGAYYGLYDFCSVNLVAQGYNRLPNPVPLTPVDVPVKAVYQESKVDSYVGDRASYAENAVGYGTDNKAYVVEEKYYTEDKTDNKNWYPKSNGK